MANSFERFHVFYQIRNSLSDKLYWETLGYVYSLSDNLYDQRKKVRRCFRERRPHKSYLMSKLERDYLNTLPETLTIYRGMTCKEYKSKEFGISWTLKKEKAEFFAFTYWRNFSTNHLKKMVHSIDIKKSQVEAYFGGRNESEIIYLGSK